MKNTINSILNNSSVANTFFNLYERWLDERGYEDIESYGDAMTMALRRGGFNCAQVKPTKRPFGVKVCYHGSILHFFLKSHGSRVAFACKVISGQVHEPAPKPVISTEDGERVPWVYAHGRLEDDMKTDIFYIRLNGEQMKDGLKACYRKDGEDREVVMHLYMHPTFNHLTGIATYADDKEAFDYGRGLVATRPHTF